jgi:hypothetical protein
MELSMRRTVRELRRALAGPLEVEERLILQRELGDAELVVAELRRHRAHTHFFKIVARGKDAAEFISVFDGCTIYQIGKSCGSGQGCFVHVSIDDAEESVASFPRNSAAWGEPRALLVVAGEGAFDFRHGKVIFDRITPLAELPWGFTQRSLTRRPVDKMQSRWRF